MRRALDIASLKKGSSGLWWFRPRFATNPDPILTAQHTESRQRSHIPIFHHFRTVTVVRGHHRCFHVSGRLAVSEVRLALPNFYNITIRIANVAARLAVLLLWLCDKLGSSISP
jgi:hypothetical protein